MAKFCTITSLEARLIGTTLDTITTAAITACCTRAENEVGKYISTRYSFNSWTTTASTPPIIVSLADDLAIGYFYRDNARGGKDAFVRSNEYLEDARSNLEKILNGKINLLDSSGNLVSELSTGSYSILSNTKDYQSTFDEDSPIAWKVDPEKLEDISDTRA